MSGETYDLRITKALNGWIVNQPGSMDVLLVPEGEDLGQAITAAIVSQRLETNEMTRQRQRADQFRSMTSTASGAGGTLGALYGAGGQGGGVLGTATNWVVPK